MVVKSEMSMEHVDEFKARKDALADLGLDPDADSEDIRDAWRRIAFHAHPDHTGGDSTNFARAKAAYDYLRKKGYTAKEADTGPRKPKRPRLRKRIIELAPEDIATCQAMLDPGRALPHMSQRDESNYVASDHVPDAVGCLWASSDVFRHNAGLPGGQSGRSADLVLSSALRAIPRPKF